MNKQILSGFPKALFFVCVSLTLALSVTTPGTADAQKGSQGTEIYRYEVKGKIVSLPKENGKPEIRIKHEAIKDYVDFSGTKVGMAAMTMSFPLAEGVSLQGLAVGDNVQFVFESWWKPSPGDHISSIKKIE